MRKAGFVTQADFNAHIHKDYHVVHHGLFGHVKGIAPTAGGVGPHSHIHTDITDWGDWLDQAVKQASEVSFAKITDTGITATNIAAGTTGQRPGGIVGDMRYNSTLGAFEVYTGAWGSLKLSGSAPTAHAASHETGGGDAIDALTFSNEGLRILDLGADHALIIKPGTDLGANRILTLTTGDAARTITLSGNPTLNDWFDQAVKQASSPTFVTAKLSALTDGYVPYHIDDATGLANSPIFTDGTRIGIGTATVPHGGVGCAKFAIDGPITSAVGPHVQLTVDIDDYPAFAIVPYAHDNISILFDAYLKGDLSSWVSSDPDSSFSIQKIADKLKIQYDVAVAGANITWNDGIVLDFAGKVGIGKVPTEKLDVDGNIKADTFLLAAGITPNLGWLSDVNLGALEEGETIRYDQATAQFIDAWGIDYDNPRLVYKIYTEFFKADDDLNDPWDGAALGAGAMASVAGTSNHPGIVRFSSVATVGSGYRFMTSVDCILIGGAEHSEFCFKTPASLTDVAARLGYQDSLTDANPTDGVFINILETTLSGKTRNNGAESTTGTDYTLAVNTWYRGKIAVNSDATSITFVLYEIVAGEQVVRWTNTLAANIPTAAGRETGHGVVAWIRAETMQPLLDLDMMIATRAGYITR